ncbi:IQ domain-containing protein F2 [Heterocephalus glaber]|uniref:IQ domain-containing protein F2 n=1 Tax=Heterocephalus glaber TaxID=10181 RepID=A0AAX6NPI2_HETGA|nr:IQ domain-containing protein F2 [Heterocephalus glaber]
MNHLKTAMGVQFCTKGSLILFVAEDNEETIKQWQLQKNKQKNLSKTLNAAAILIQAWWRGTLVRRTLLHAALSAWVIQYWWQQMMAQLLEKRRRAVLVDYTIRERAVITLQSLVRMWCVHWRYCQVLNAIYVIQGHWQCHNCQTCAFLRGHCKVTATHLQFHIEIIN